MNQPPNAGKSDQPPFGLGRDLSRLKTNASASLAELRAFLAQTRGRAPQEVLGMLTGSQLVRCIGWAAIGAVVVLLVGTIVPYLWYGPPAPHTPGKSPAAARPDPAQPTPAAQGEPAAPPAAATAQNTGAEASADPAVPSEADKNKAVKIMGLGETKVADPKKNPMEKSLDNLLDKTE